MNWKGCGREVVAASLKELFHHFFGYSVGKPTRNLRNFRISECQSRDLRPLGPLALQKLLMLRNP
jgi:hypothetical protein